MWSKLISIVCLLSISTSLVWGNTVPVIMYSHRLSPGLLRYQINYNYKQTITNDSIKIISKELIENCNSDAYIFINIPGLLEYDLVKYRDEFKYLEQYLQTSTTGLTFEKVDYINDNTFNELIGFTKHICNVNKFMSLRGNDTRQYEPYLDTDKRVIRIDFPPLNGTEEEWRSETISHYDKYLRTVIAQIPSPHQTVILTSLDSDGKALTDLNKEYIKTMIEYDGIFNDVIKEKSDIEKNHRVNDVPLVRNRHKPLYEGLSDEYVSIFDNDFIQDNYQLLQIIGTTIIAFVGYQIFTRTTTTTKPHEATRRKLKVSKKGMKKDSTKENELEIATKKTEVVSDDID